MKYLDRYRHGEFIGWIGVCARPVATRRSLESQPGKIFRNQESLCRRLVGTRSNRKIDVRIGTSAIQRVAMTTTTAGIQLSAEAGVRCIAIQGALAPRFDGRQGQMEMLAGQMTSLQTELGQLSAQVQHQDQRMTKVTDQRHYGWESAVTGAASSPASSDACFESSKPPAAAFPPKNETYTALAFGSR